MTATPAARPDPPTPLTVRPATPADYDAIAAVVDAWWGRPLLDLLPRLFLDHFHRTSLVAVDDALAGFLIGFVSPSQPGQAYIHFVGVAPEHRTHGLGRTLYERFFGLAREHGCDQVAAVTSPVNRTSIAFHRRLGFVVSEPIEAYDGPGHTLVHFRRDL